MILSMSKAPVLIGIHYSPWTLRARWALEHHAVDYRYQEHLLIVGMPELRLRTGKWLSGDLTVPALCGPDGVWMDSWVIARHAEEVGKGTPLFGSDTEASRIQELNGQCEEAVAAMRALAALRTPRDPEARAEALDPVAPRALQGALGWVASLGAGYVMREFGVDASAGEAPFLEAIRSVCEGFRSRLAESGGKYALGDRRGFSYADILMATTLQGVSPVTHPSVELGKGTRRVWTNPALARDFGDLLAWRDSVYQTNRGPAGQRG
jgi:glutathione S-transferase